MRRRTRSWMRWRRTGGRGVCRDLAGVGAVGADDGHGRPAGRGRPGADGALGGGRADTEEGLELFDAAGVCRRGLVLPVRLDTAALRAQAEDGRCRRCSAGWSASPRVERGERGGGGSLARRLAGVPEAEREGVVLELVRAEIASVSGARLARDRSAGSGRSTSWARLADGAGAAQPAERGHRAASAGDARVRLSHPRGARRATWWARSRTPAR